MNSDIFEAKQLFLTTLHWLVAYATLTSATNSCYWECGSARLKYSMYLEKKKVLKTQAVTAQKRKSSFDEVEQLNK